jgi:ABC-type Fe3+ transport system permease subunit
VFLPLLVPGLAVTFCLAFVQAFAVFPSAVLLGAPAGPTRVISIAAYQAAFEQYDHSLGSAIALIMGGVELVVVLAVLGGRSFFYRGPPAARKAEHDPRQGTHLENLALCHMGAGGFCSCSICSRHRRRRRQFVRDPLARHLAAGRLDDEMVF